jgi:MFS family permease
MIPPADGTRFRSPALSIAFRVFLPFALGYFLSYVFRVVNAVIAPDLVADLGLDAGALGLLTSTYFLTFAAFQLPLGILLDRFGPRRTEALLLLVAAAGAFLSPLPPPRHPCHRPRAHRRRRIGLLDGRLQAFVSGSRTSGLAPNPGLQMAVGGIGALPPPCRSRRPYLHRLRGVFAAWRTSPSGPRALF